MHKVTCVICSRVFHAIKNNKYCSNDCVKEAAKRNREARPLRHKEAQIRKNNRCPICDKLIAVESKWCVKHKNPSYKKGPAAPNWKGGRSWRNGYRLIRMPEHPRAVHGRGYVLEHIIVWEQTHDRPVPEGWVVHHINGLRDDNRPSNLVAIPDKKHQRIFDIKNKRIQELEALLKGQGSLI